MDQDTREVRDQVEEARERVGDTVEALAYKANAPRRLKDDARRRLVRTKQRVTSHPQIARLRQASARSATENDPAAAAATDAPSLRQRAQPAINAATRVPPTVGAAAGCGLLLGVVFGRAIGRRSAR